MDNNFLYKNEVLSVEILPVFIPPEEGKSPWGNVDITDYSFAKKCYGNASTCEEYQKWAYWELHDFLMSAPGLTYKDCKLINDIIDYGATHGVKNTLADIHINCKIEVKIHNNSGSMDFTMSYEDGRTDSVFILVSDQHTLQVADIAIILAMDTDNLMDVMRDRFNEVIKTCSQCTPDIAADYYSDKVYAEKIFGDYMATIYKLKNEYGDDIVTDEVSMVFKSAFDMMYANRLAVQGNTTPNIHPFDQMIASHSLFNMLDANTGETDTLITAYFVARQYIIPTMHTADVFPAYALMALFTLEHTANAYIERDKMNIAKVETLTFD